MGSGIGDVDIMSEQKKTMIDSFKDKGEQTVTEWGNKFIETNVPKSLDWVITRIKETVLSMSKDNNKKMSEQIRDVIFQGIEIGEGNKESAIIQAMKNAGMDENTIQAIISDSNKYLVTRADYEASLMQKRK